MTDSWEAVEAWWEAEVEKRVRHIEHAALHELARDHHRRSMREVENAGREVERAVRRLREARVRMAEATETVEATCRLMVT